MKIIGISGKVGTGKSTLTGHLMDLLGAGWQRRAFGDALKEEVAELFGFPLEWCYSEEGKNATVAMPREIFVQLWRAGFSAAAMYVETPENAMTVRGILHWWGTDIRRVQDLSYWDRRMEVWLDNLPADTPGVVIDDVRFLSETRLIKRRGGRLYHLEPYDGWACPPEIAGHVSETELDGYGGWDCVFCPRFGELEEYAKAIIAINSGAN